MATQTTERDRLARIWECHRETVRRLLIGLGRDLDLADDLLQETYLRAQAGITGYRGENPRAWLAVIARNAYLTHVRKQQVRSEVALDQADKAIRHPGLCPQGRVDLLAIRQAIAELPPQFRTALIMKHYGGFTYQEIGAELHCPVGTAKWRVNEAIGRLRAALEIGGRPEMVCTNSVSAGILDYLYGLLPPDQAAPVRAHLDGCAGCREQAEELRGMISRLDALEGDHRMMHMVELDREGTPTSYATWSFINAGDEPLAEIGFSAGKCSALLHLSQDAAEMPFERRQDPQSEHRFRYTARLRRPVPPGERFRMLGVFRPDGEHAARGSEESTFQFSRSHCPGENETVFVQAIRLPGGARLVCAEPEPNEVKRNGATTLLWRCLLPPMHQFECLVHYRL